MESGTWRKFLRWGNAPEPTAGLVLPTLKLRIWKASMFRVSLRGRLLILFLACLPVMAAADEQPVEYGKYVCITDRAVGFQTPENGGQRYAGSILMSPEKQKFFATIRKIDTIALDPTVGWIKHGIIQHIPERCFAKEHIENLEKQWQAGKGMNYSGPNVDDFFEWCLAHNAVELTSGSLTYKYYSINKNVFVDQFADRFWISNGWKFSWTFSNLSGLVPMWTRDPNRLLTAGGAQ
jgi:hypothetical protein